MLKRPIGRLAAVVAVAGTAAALAATAAVAAPNATWSLPSHPIPGAVTNDSPSVGDISFNSALGQGTIVAWRGRGFFGHVFYKFRTPVLGHWSRAGVVPGAFTSSSPVIIGYGGSHDPLGRDAVVAVWTGHADHHIWYAEGETHPTGTISWTRPKIIPNTVRYAGSIEAPTAFFPNNKYVMVVAWRGPANHVRYSVGTPLGRGFIWSQSALVPGGTLGSPVHCVFAPCTSATPALAEVQISGSAGIVYAFWKQLGTDNIFYATTIDGPATNWNHLVWTAPVQVPLGAATTQAPAVSALPPIIGGPLLLVYKGPVGTGVRFQTLTGATWSSWAFVPGAHTAVAPALRGATLATTTPVTFGRIVLQFFH
jgi:hypothetical protein